MSYMNVKCDVCQTSVVFDEEPYRNPIATRYWRSTYVQPTDALLVVQRKIPNINSKGKQTIQIMTEFILRIYCSAKCALDDY